MVVWLLSDGIYLYKVAYLWEKWESILVLCVSGGIKIIVILKWEKIRSVMIFWGLIDGRNMFPESSLIFSLLLVGGFDVPYSTCICLTVAVWPLILKTCVRATPYYTYLPPIPFKIAQYFFLPIYRSHCACALRDCRLIVHTITGVCWIFHSRKISKYLYCACIPTYVPYTGSHL